MAPVIRALVGTPAVEPVVCVTDQHREMLDQVLEFFDIRPDHRLGVMREGQSPSEVAARVLQRLPPVLVKVDPAAVLVQGDTTTTLAAALAAFYCGNPDVELAYPVHLNPRVQEPVLRVLDGHSRVHLLPPLDYWDLVDLLRRCYLVLTDSGGIQEEAPSLGKPVLVMRETTERPEGVEAGTARLVGTSRERIVVETERLLRDSAAYARMAQAHSPYGDGRSGERIAGVLAATFAARRVAANR